MVRRKRTASAQGTSPRGKQRKRSKQQKHSKSVKLSNATVLQREVLDWLVPPTSLFAGERLHGNIKWDPRQLASQALMWSWQETRYVTDAFDHAQEACEILELDRTAGSYTSLMNALTRYAGMFSEVCRQYFQGLVEQVSPKLFRYGKRAVFGFDGSRLSAPRTESNEESLCAPNYGNGKTAKYRKKKSQGLRRKRNKAKPAEPQKPQAWITMIWHMQLRLPWTWRLGPSNSSERAHVLEMLGEEFPAETLFCGDAGFVGYPLWQAMLSARCDFLVRVGANVRLLSETADVKRYGGGNVLCWPKGQLNSGKPPLRLRLVQVKVGKTKMWMLTNVLSARELPKKKIARLYAMRWGIEVEFRGLKQTLDKRKLQCRNSDRLLVELDWSIRGMAFAELVALREQVAARTKRQAERTKQRAAGKQATKSAKQQPTYDPQDRSLANTMRALRRCLRNLDRTPADGNDLLCELAAAQVQRYHHRTTKQSRYRPKNPDKKPLGDPQVRKINDQERRKLTQLPQKLAA